MGLHALFFKCMYAWAPCPHDPPWPSGSLHMRPSHPFEFPGGGACADEHSSSPWRRPRLARNGALASTSCGATDGGQRPAGPWRGVSALAQPAGRAAATTAAASRARGSVTMTLTSDGDTRLITWSETRRADWRLGRPVCTHGAALR
jgi:hypothetical protein